MNSHDIELPPLPTIDVMGKSKPQVWFTALEMDDLRRAAIESDRKQHDRMLAHEWIRPALGLSEDAPYRFDFYAQQIEGMKADRQRRGEPVAWSYEYHDFGDVWVRHSILNRPDGGANPPTKHHGSPIRNVVPLFANPVVKDSLTVEPVAWAVFADNGNIRIWCADPIQAETLKQQYGNQLKPLYDAPQPAVPTQHPSYDRDCCHGHNPEPECKCAAHDAYIKAKRSHHPGCTI